MTWNYRVVSYEDHLRIYDVYYDDNGKPTGRHEQPTYIYGDTIGSLREQIDWILEAFNKPILEDSEIGRKSSKVHKQKIQLSREYVSLLLYKFSECYEGSSQQLETVEDIKSLLWVMLRSHFDRLEPQENLKRFLSGFSDYCPAFGIPELNLLIDAYWIDEETEILQVRQELLGDIPGFLRDAANNYTYMTLLFYDPNNKIDSVTQFVSSMKVGQITDVVLVQDNNLSRGVREFTS